MTGLHAPSSTVRALGARTLDVLDVNAAGILVGNEGSQLRLAASTSDRAPFGDIFRTSAALGPCLDSYQRGEPVVCGDLASEDESWPEFRSAARQWGLRTVIASPMRADGVVVGVISLLAFDARRLTHRELQFVEVLADIATLWLEQERQARSSRERNEQLQRALDGRVVIEQAKGVLAASGLIDVEAAFSAMRHSARSHSVKLRDVAAEVAMGSRGRLAAAIVQQSRTNGIVNLDAVAADEPHARDGRRTHHDDGA